MIPEEFQPTLKLITRKPLLPTEEEVAENNRSRSAKLRIAEKSRKAKGNNYGRTKSS